MFEGRHTHSGRSIELGYFEDHTHVQLGLSLSAADIKLLKIFTQSTQ
jgi:hypothetical protein